jgi:endonuclease/exonuclease/phosphatase family metal-dependent hydrolase
MMLRIATLNLGLTNKKELVKNLIIQENIDVLCLQETEIEINVDHTLLSFPQFNYESEINSRRSRVGCYINSNISYVRRYELEGIDSHIVILDIKGNSSLRLINLYRCFNPQGEMSALDFFKYQLDIVHQSYTSNTILLGDFNLDWSKKGLINYPFKKYFDYMGDELAELNLVQMVNFSTWSRIINGVKRMSILDHIYTSDPTAISNLYSENPIFGDHVVLIFNCGIKNEKKTCYL